MLVHTGLKNFQCEVCKKKFFQKGDLNRHILTHTKIKAHECDICKKKFSRKGSLVTHFRIHLGEKPYGCAECGKWFTQGSNRNQKNLYYSLNSKLFAEQFLFSFL